MKNSLRTAHGAAFFPRQCMQTCVASHAALYCVCTCFKNTEECGPDDDLPSAMYPKRLTHFSQESSFEEEEEGREDLQGFASKQATLILFAPRMPFEEIRAKVLKLEDLR